MSKKKCSLCHQSFTPKGPSIDTWLGVRKTEYRVVNYRGLDGMRFYAINDTTDEVYCGTCYSSSTNMHSVNTSGGLIRLGGEVLG